MRMEWFRHGLLRLKLRLFSCTVLGVFFIFCIFVVYTVFGFLELGNLQMLSVTSCLLYLTTQFSSYYLLYAPCMVILLSGLNDFGAFELFINVRCASKKAYNLGQFAAIFLLAIVCIIGCVGAAGIVYRFAAHPEADWRICDAYLQSHGIYLVSEGFTQFPAAFVIFAQLAMSMLSFYALGIFLLLLRNLFQKTFLVLATGLSTNFLLLLSLKNDLPSWLFSILPYPHLFLPYLDSLTDFLNAVIYWLCIIACLHLVLWLASKLQDRGITEYEK